MRAWTILVLAATWLAPSVASAGCSVLSMEGETLVVDEAQPGSWEAAADAAKKAFNEAKAAGDMFDRVYLGGYKRQAVQADLQTAEAEWTEALAAAQEAALAFTGTCAGELLEDVLRKATRYHEPEMTMVNNMLAGKPLQQSHTVIHDGRNQDYRSYERKLQVILDNAEVRGPSVEPLEEEAPIEEPPIASPTE